MSDYIVIHGIKVHKDHANFVSETFGRLTTIGPRFLLPTGTKGDRRCFQVCQCECGSIRIYSTTEILRNKIKSCGCLSRELSRQRKTKHGLSKTKEYQSWRGAIYRCNAPKHKSYPNYGGRGIRVCDRWLEPNGRGFLNFLEDMGNMPPECDSIERENVNGNYCPENCYWTTTIEQANNRRSTVYLTALGQTRRLSEWATLYAIRSDVITKRLRRGWTVERAITTPIQTNRYPKKK